MNLEVISLKMLILIHKFQSPEDAGLLKIVKLTLELLEIKKKSMKTWSKNLNDVPAIENYDVMKSYLYK